MSVDYDCLCFSLGTAHCLSDPARPPLRLICFNRLSCRRSSTFHRLFRVLKYLRSYQYCDCNKEEMRGFILNPPQKAHGTRHSLVMCFTELGGNEVESPQSSRINYGDWRKGREGSSPAYLLPARTCAERSKVSNDISSSPALPRSTDRTA